MLNGADFNVLDGDDDEDGPGGCCLAFAGAGAGAAVRCRAGEGCCSCCCCSRCRSAPFSASRDGTDGLLVAVPTDCGVRFVVLDMKRRELVKFEFLCVDSNDDDELHRPTRPLPLPPGPLDA